MSGAVHPWSGALSGSAGQSGPADQITTIRPAGRWARLQPAEIWRYRDLLWLLALRDVRVRYKQAVLGAAWALIQPVVTMIVLAGFFGGLMDMEERVGSGTPYPIFLYAGLLPWMLFSSAVTASSNSLVSAAGILKKVYFPRLIVPLASAGAPLVDYALGATVLLGMMFYYGVGLSWSMLLLPMLLASTLIAVFGVSLVVAALTVAYRDFRHVVPFMVQVLFFLTPVIYPVSIVPERFRWLLMLNPMGGTTDAFRAAILGRSIDYGPWAISTAIGAVMVILGLAYFQRVEQRFADVV